MKLTALLLFAACLGASAHGWSQQVTLQAKETPLQKVFEEIEAQTGYTFVYRDEWLREARKVSCMLTNASLTQALEACFKDQPFSYVLVQKIVVIKPLDRTVAEKPVADSGKVRGTVYNAEGQPLSGATVTVVETHKGALTNAKGEFELIRTPDRSTLLISYIGYTPKRISITGDEKIVVRLTLADNQLDEMVVQAYGTTTRRLATGNIAKVSSAEIERQPVMNPLLALQGKVAGLDITQTNGFASAPIKVELRGRSTINSNFTSDPLYIIDGVPLTVLEVGGQSTYTRGSTGFLQAGFNGPAGGQSPLFSINPSDIDHIEVLKDADATAIYGSRGANGVILITTKKGRVGKTKLDIHVQQGISKQTRFWKMLNTQQYLAMRREALKNDGIEPSLGNGDYDLLLWDTTRYTDWQKALYGGTGHTTDVQAGLSGGDANTTFRIGTAYSRGTSIQTVSGSDQRGSLSLNLAHYSADQKFGVTLTAVYVLTKSAMTSLPGAITLPPNAPAIYDSLGNLNYDGWGGNNTSARSAYAFSNLRQPYASRTNFLNSNLVIHYQIMKGLKLSSNFGYNNAVVNQTNYQLIASQDPLQNPKGTAYLGNNTNKSWIIEPQLSYDAFISKGKLSALIAGSISQVNTDGSVTAGRGFTNDALITSISKALTQSTLDYQGEYRYAALFGRLNYNWENKYILSLNGRRDGSSRFGPGKQYGVFGSVGLAWNFTEEKWFDKQHSFLSFGKIRASYGTTGNDAVGDYQYLTRWSTNGTQPYSGTPSLMPTQHANPDFHWEVNKKLEAALDLGFFKDRLNLNIAYYRNRCGDQLVGYKTPSISGFSVVTANLPALVQNSGIEISMSARIIATKNFSWAVNFNTAFNRNKLLSYPGLDQSPYSSTLVVGQSLNIMRLLHYTGVDPQTGEYSFEDKNKDGQINMNPGQPNDDTYIYNLSPKFLGGLEMNFTYKALQVSLSFNIKKQLGINAIFLGNNPGTIGNQPLEIFGKQWQKPGDIASVAKFSTMYYQSSNNFINSNGLYTDASYIRLSNLAISYSLPASLLKKVAVKDCSVFIRTNNLFTITGYKGLDPETQSFGSLPPSRIVVGGLSFNF